MSLKLRLKSIAEGAISFEEAKPQETEVSSTSWLGPAREERARTRRPI